MSRLSRFLVGYLAAYGTLLVSVSLLSSQKVLSMHKKRCFDDWCASVEKVELKFSIGEVRAQGTYYLVSIHVSSQAKRVSQRALDASVYVLDQTGKRYDPSPEEQQALEATGEAGQSISSLVEPGGVFKHVAVFDLPPGTTRLDVVISHGVFPGLIIIGDPQSFLHKPTVIRITFPH